MRPIPLNISIPWRPMWHTWSHPERPWWRKGASPFSGGGLFGSGSSVPTPQKGLWERVDGRQICTIHPRKENSVLPDERVVLGWVFLEKEERPQTGTWVDELISPSKVPKCLPGGPWPTAESVMVWLDEHYPLPEPLPLPGQVWVYPDGSSAALSAVSNAEGPGMKYTAHSSGVSVQLIHHSEDPWPPPEAILVAGPTPWGRDVPWSPAMPVASSAE